MTVPGIAAGESFRLDLDGWDAHVLRWASPDPDAGRVVLLHGGAGHAHAWGHLAGRLSDRFTVVALDQRGHGESGPTDRYGSKVLADDVGRLLDALGWPSSSLVGHSMGGQAAYLFAAAHPDRVERLVVIDTGPEADPTGIARIRANLAGPDSFATLDDALAEGRRWFPGADETLLRERIEHNLVSRPDGTLAWRTATAVRAGDTPRDDYSEDERWAAWEELSVPTLLIHGADSDLLTDALVARFTESNPAILVERIEAAGHSVPLDQPDALADVVASFLTHHIS
jgi:pimeloyl-ACP methyl ester carboxylesterase